MSAKNVYDKVCHNPNTMANTLPSAEEWNKFTYCAGIHGAMKQRKGVKRGTVCARRRMDKEVIKEAEQELLDKE